MNISRILDDLIVILQTPLHHLILHVINPVTISMFITILFQIDEVKEKIMKEETDRMYAHVESESRGIPYRAQRHVFYIKSEPDPSPSRESEANKNSLTQNHQSELNSGNRQNSDQPTGDITEYNGYDGNFNLMSSTESYDGVSLKHELIKNLVHIICYERQFRSLLI